MQTLVHPDCYISLCINPHVISAYAQCQGIQKHENYRYKMSYHLRTKSSGERLPSIHSALALFLSTPKEIKRVTPSFVDGPILVSEKAKVLCSTSSSLHLDCVDNFNFPTISNLYDSSNLQNYRHRTGLQVRHKCIHIKVLHNS